VDQHVKTVIRVLVSEALAQLQIEAGLAQEPIEFLVENTKSREHGDLAVNAAMAAAKRFAMKPRELAEKLTAKLASHPAIEKIVIAGPGFMNFFVRAEQKSQVLLDVLEQADGFGASDFGQQLTITLEYVSANPTGPLHVGHGRGAAYGSSLSNIMRSAGFNVQREYYVNDYGRQMDIMATSLYLRYCQLVREQNAIVRFPENAYKGAYVTEMAEPLRAQFGDSLLRDPHALMKDLPPDESQGGDKDKHVDALIANAKEALGAAGFRAIYDFALTRLQASIGVELKAFNVEHDEWFSERSLAESGALERVLEELKARNELELRDGAWWFKATQYGDEKDRVVFRENGQSTYFASDIAYLKNKFERGYQHAIYVLGADHHGYIARLKAAAMGFGIDPNRVEICLVQFARLFKDGKEVAMGKREGQFVTLSDLREEVGTDAARFFYVMRSHEQHLDFDLELAKKQSADNPVYYVQYAHARICRVFQRIGERGLSAFDVELAKQHFNLLSEPREQDLLSLLARFPEQIQTSASMRAPHVIANYLRELAAQLHGLYDSPPRVEILCPEAELRNARLLLMHATRTVLKNGLRLLGVSAPETM
jgi:arginyl-tRNA synthetase